MARKKREVDYGGGGSWMDTYGDMITLVLTFFILLFSMSSVDSAKWKTLVDSVTGRITAIAEPMDPGPANMSDPIQMEPGGVDRDSSSEGKTPSELQQQQNEINQQFIELFEKLVQYIKDNGMSDTVAATKTGNMINIRFSDSVFFETGKADLLPEALDTINRLIPFLEESQDVIETIRIEGHTDNVPINTAKFKDNWWLSYHRAGNVVDYLIHNTQILPSKLSADGYGEYRPIESNDTPEGRAKNRRVQFVIYEMVLFDPNEAPDATDPYAVPTPENSDGLITWTPAPQDQWKPDPATTGTSSGEWKPQGTPSAGPTWTPMPSQTTP